MPDLTPEELAEELENRDYDAKDNIFEVPFVARWDEIKTVRHIDMDDILWENAPDSKVWHPNNDS